MKLDKNVSMYIFSRFDVCMCVYLCLSHTPALSGTFLGAINSLSRRRFRPCLSWKKKKRKKKERGESRLGHTHNYDYDPIHFMEESRTLPVVSRVRKIVNIYIHRIHLIFMNIQIIVCMKRYRRRRRLRWDEAQAQSGNVNPLNAQQSPLLVVRAHASCMCVYCAIKTTTKRMASAHVLIISLFYYLSMAIYYVYKFWIKWVNVKESISFDDVT